MMYAMTLGARIKTARTGKGWSQSAMAHHLSVTRNAVSMWESGKAEPKSETLRQLSMILDVNFDWLATGREDQAYLVKGLALHGTVAAGIWQEVVESQDNDVERVPVAPDPRYPDDAQYALRVRGQSVNRVAPDGSILHCVDIIRASITVRPGDLVCVERRRGAMVEATVKRLRRGSKGLELWPESTDPAHQEPVIVNGSDADKVEIKGLILHALIPVSRGE